MRRIIIKLCIFLSYLYPTKLMGAYHVFSSKISTYAKLRDCSKKTRDIYIDKSTKVTGTKYWIVGERVFIHKNCRIDAIKYGDGEPTLSIGNSVSIGDDTHIGCIRNVTIGNNTLVSAKCLIIDHSHGNNIDELDIPPSRRKLYSKGGCMIGDNCWIGENVIVLPGVHIGDGSIIGAGAVVTHDIPNYSLAVGNPAKVIKKLV